MTVKIIPVAERFCAGEALFCSSHQNLDCQSNTKLAFDFEFFRFLNPNFTVTVGVFASTIVSLELFDFEEGKLLEKFPIPIMHPIPDGLKNQKVVIKLIHFFFHANFASTT